MSLIRTSILALTAAVAVGSALASSTTSAQAWHHHHHHWKKWHGHHSYYRPYYYAAPVVYSSYRPAPRVVSAPAPAPVANPASCLSKAYTPEGQVVFSDNCTKESAMAPVPNVPQQQSQMPAQQNFAGKPQQ